MRTLIDVLRSVSDTMFPDDLGERVVEIDSTDIEGDTPLHVLVWRSDLEGVNILIGAGADVNALGDMLESPLHAALRVGNPDIAEALLRAGARDDIRGDFGETPWEMAQGRPEYENLFRRRDDT